MMIYHIFKYPKILIHSHRGRWELKKHSKTYHNQRQILSP